MEKKTKYFSVFIVACCFILLFAFALPSTQNISYADEGNQGINVSASSMDYKNGTLFYTNTENRKIFSVTNGQEPVELLQTESTPILVCSDYDGNFFYTQDGRFGFSDRNNNYKEIEKKNMETVDLGNVFDMDTDINGNLFVACQDKNVNNLMLKKEKGGNLSVFCELSDDITLNANSKISVSPDKNYLVLYSNNKFYHIDDNGVVPISDYTDLNTVSNNVLDIKLDYNDSLYVLANQKITKHTQTEKTEFSDASLNSTLTFEVDYLSGDLYLMGSDKIMEVTTQGFVDPLSSTTDNTLQDKKYDCFLITTTKDATVYLYDNCLYHKTINSQNVVIESGKTVCALEKKNDFYFVLLTNVANENITGFVKVDDVNLITTPTQTKQAKILYNNTPLYSLPSSIGERFAKNEQNQPIFLTKGTLYDVVVENFAETDFNGKKFTQILYHGNTYFIETYHYVINGSTTIQPLDEQENLNNNHGGSKLTTGEIVGIVLILITFIVGVIFIIFTIIKHKNKKELKVKDF